MRALLVVLFAAAASAQSPVAAEPLFDGQTLAGWRGDPAIWKVQDGCIVGSSAGVAMKHNTFLVLDGRQPADFELVVQVQLEGDNNSGIQYRSRELPGDPFRVAGPQCDLHPAPNYVAMLYDEQGAGIVAEHGQLRRWADDGITTLGTIANQRPVDLRQWHQLRIVAMGALVWHELDDVPVTAWLDQRAAASRAGVIALQAHRGAPMTVRFRSPLLRTWSNEAAMRKDVPVPPAIVGLLAQAVAQRVSKLEAAASGKVGSAVPKWIWDADAGADEELFFRRELSLPKVPERAELIVSADNHCRVYVNGERLGNSDEWESLLRLDAKKVLRAGLNVIAVHAWNDGGPAGLLLRLEGKHEGGSFELVSDASWLVGDDDPDGWDKPAFAADGWAAAKELGALGAGSLPWSGTHGPEALGVATDPFQPQVATVATNVTYPVPVPGDAAEPRIAEVAPRFRTAWPEPVLQLLAVPRGLGSWVSLCADPQGRLYAGAQGGGLYRVTPTDTVGGTSTIERVPVEVGGPHGLLWFRDALYVVQNEKEPGLYRLTDGDGDGMLDRKELLQALDGRGEHGPHSVLVAPGGERLLIVAGNHTKLPKLASSRVPLNFAEDRLLPRLDDPHKYWEGHSPPGGWACLCDADGKNWELITCGFRNPFDAAVLPNGEVVVYDADMEWDLGMPWYRPTRLLKVISGVDYGWRIGSAKWPTDYPDAPPAWRDIGPGSPTGMAVQKQFRGDLPHSLALDWTFGIAYQDDRPWLMGAPLPLCDVAVVGGATYLVTGGRGLPTTLLRVPEGHDDRVLGLTVDDDLADPPMPLAAQAPVGRWESLVANCISNSMWPSRVDEVNEARAALERQPVASWREQALAIDPAQPQLAVQGLIALARQGSPADLQPILDAIGKLPFASLQPLDRIGWLRVHALALLRQGPASAEQRDALIARLLPLFPQGDERQDQDLAELLAYLQAPGFVDKAIAQLEPLRPSPVPAWAEIATRGDVYGQQYGGVITAMAKSMPPIGQLAIADALRIVKTGWTIDQRRRYFRFLQQARQQKGGASYDGFLKRMLDAAWEACSETERRELEADFTAARADAPKFQAVPPQGPGKDWQLADLDAVLQPGLADADVTRGRNLFHAASCAACHYFAGEGGGRGPDLTSLGTKFDARSILEAIVAPSAVVSDQYTGQVLTLNDGRQRFGAVSKGFFGDSEVYELMAAEPDSLLERFPVQSVAKVEKSPLSPMPADLVDRLSAAELRDLLAFLLSRGAGK